jgi:hypothetical protein
MGRFRHVEENHTQRCAAVRAGRPNRPKATCRSQRTVRRWPHLLICREPSAGLVTMQTVVQVQATRFAEMFARFLIAAAFVLVCSASTIEAMPFQSDQSFNILVLSIADKCGIGSYRDANGVCRRKYLFGRTRNSFTVHAVA